MAQTLVMEQVTIKDHRMAGNLFLLKEIKVGIMETTRKEKTTGKVETTKTLMEISKIMTS